MLMFMQGSQPFKAEPQNSEELPQEEAAADQNCPDCGHHWRTLHTTKGCTVPSCKCTEPGPIESGDDEPS